MIQLFQMLAHDSIPSQAHCDSKAEDAIGACNLRALPFPSIPRQQAAHSKMRS